MACGEAQGAGEGETRSSIVVAQEARAGLPCDSYTRQVDKFPFPPFLRKEDGTVRVRPPPSLGRDGERITASRRAGLVCEESLTRNTQMVYEKPSDEKQEQKKRRRERTGE